MASLHVACGVNDWQCKNEVPRILINNNYDIDTDSYYKKRKCDLSYCKENVTYNRKRSKSESHKSLELINDTSRNRTFSVNRTMHDKAMNVCMMPNNMQDLLLDEYRKNELNWQNDMPGNQQQEKFTDEQPILNQVPISNIFKHKYEYDNQRERLVGVKRSREKSPNVLDESNGTSAIHDVPNKIHSRTMLEIDSSLNMGNGLSTKPQKEKTPPLSNGTSNIPNGICKQNTNIVDLSPNKCKYDSDYSPLVKLKHEHQKGHSTENDTSEVNSISEEISVSEACQDSSLEETEEECECCKNTSESE